MRKKKDNIRELLQNKRNIRFYKVHDEYECGLALNSPVLRKILTFQLSLSGSYGWLKNNELFLRGFHEKEIKLLLNRHEINKIIRYIKEKKYLLIPRNLYLKNHRIKLGIVIAQRLKNTSRERLESIRERDERRMQDY